MTSMPWSGIGPRWALRYPTQTSSPPWPEMYPFEAHATPTPPVRILMRFQGAVFTEAASGRVLSRS